MHSWLNPSIYFERKMAFSRLSSGSTSHCKPDACNICLQVAVRLLHLASTSADTAVTLPKPITASANPIMGSQSIMRDASMRRLHAWLPITLGLCHSSHVHKHCFLFHCIPRLHSSAAFCKAAFRRKASAFEILSTILFPDMSPRRFRCPARLVIHAFCG